MFKIEKNRDYEIRLMPNYFDVSTPILQLKKNIY
jgi:hypothetical protein